MRIKAVNIKNFISFGSFAWLDLDPQLNVVVGPNGVGKTNLFHALRAVKDSLSNELKEDSILWSQMTHRHSNTPLIEIALDIQFTSEWEKRLLCAFVAASMCDEHFLRDNNPAGLANPDEFVQFSNFLLETVQPENLDWLFAGKFVVQYDGLNWNCRYEGFGSVFHLPVKGLQNVSLIAGPVWNEFFKGIILRKKEIELLTPSIQAGLDRFVDQARGFVLRVERPGSVVLPTHRSLEQLAGFKLENNRFSQAQFIFQILFGRAFVFTDNIRRRPLYNFSEQEFNAQNIDLSDGEQLALYLFKKKNGVPGERKQYDAIREMFSRLTGRNFDVGLGNPVNQGTNLDLHLADDWGDIPLEFSGAGIAEALFLSTLIASDDGRIILLDEPALTIHVTMQKALLSEIRTQMGNEKQFIIVTHSPTLVDPGTITKVSYFSVRQGNTYRTAISQSNMNDEELVRLKQELRKSLESRALLFTRGVILVEGETELAALPIWYERQFNQSVEGLDIVLYNVGGDQNFKQLVKFLHLFGIPWVIICDGKVISYYLDGHEPMNANKSIVEQLEEAGLSCASHLNKIDFLQLCQELESFGVFTLAKNANDEIEGLPVIMEHLGEARNRFPKSKVRQAQYIAECYSCPNEVAVLLQKAVSYLKSPRAIEIGNGK